MVKKIIDIIKEKNLVYKDKELLPIKVESKEVKTFDRKGRLVKSVVGDYVIEFEYDDSGRLIHQFNNEGFEEWREYEGEGESLAIVLVLENGVYTLNDEELEELE